MTETTHPPLPMRRALGMALDGALQWRLWLLWIATTLGCALIGSLPLWAWLAAQLNHSVHVADIATGDAPMLLFDALMARDAPLPLLIQNVWIGGALMLLLSPWLAGAAVAAARAPERLGFGGLVRGGIAEYGPMLRMLLWSAIPIGVALLVATMFLGANERANENAVVAAEASTGRTIGMVLGCVLLLLAHAGIEAGRGWLAADPRLRSALKAWWRGMGLMRRRPVAVLGVYLVPTLLGLGGAALLLMLRPHVGGASLPGFMLALLLTCAITAALAWGRIARLFGMKALAADLHGRR